MNNNYIIFPKINPIILSFGPIKLYWYGLMYLIGFIFILWLANKRIKKINNNWLQKEINNLVYISFFGAFIGGRIGYVLFYNLINLLNNPYYIFKIWEGGMSFHGGLIGVIYIIWWYTKKNNYFFQVTDFIAPLIPLGLGLGRIGNFINNELLGRVTLNTPWAILSDNSFNQDIKIINKYPFLLKFFKKYGALPRHPSQLYETFFEGIILFIILNFFIYKKIRPIGSISGLFLISYGVLRIIIEFFREPDIQLGLFNGISMGQILSIPMIIIGTLIMLLSYYK